MLRRTALSLTLSAAISASAFAANEIDALMTKPEKVGMSTERLARIGKRMQEYIDRNKVAGTVTLVARHGKIVNFEALGYSDREKKIPMKKDDIFVLMSMTKPIASTALMMQYENGKFLLSDPISKWLPEFAHMQVKAPDGQGGFKLIDARPITVRHILTHTAGLPALGSPEARAIAGAKTVRERVKLMATQPLAFQPGDKWEYGYATDVVAALAEVLSGQNMDDYFREHIFKPLGMTDTYYNVPEAKWDRRPTVYSPKEDGTIDPRPRRDPSPTTVFGGVAGLSGTPLDYFRFAQMILNGGEYNGARILSPKTIDTMISNQIGDGIPVTLKGPGYGFGLGFCVLMDPGKAAESLTPGTFGWGGAWGTYFFIDPVEDMIGILAIQITSYRHINIRPDLGTLAEQAILEPHSSGEQKIRGYAVLH
ncbi:MAG TPA: serine hydrolase domain-containing protein [Bryobacteraceae bacterium]|nr:serine hydrolase domain-containing protein [Bryobacteraceae bacterium]